MSLEKVVEGVVGNRENTSFWKDFWVDDVSLRVRFPHLYSISNQNDCKIGDMGERVGSNWNWVFAWRQNLFCLGRGHI